MVQTSLRCKVRLRGGMLPHSIGVTPLLHCPTPITLAQMSLKSWLCCGNNEKYLEHIKERTSPSDSEGSVVVNNIIRHVYEDEYAKKCKEQGCNIFDKKRAHAPLKCLILQHAKVEILATTHTLARSVVMCKKDKWLFHVYCEKLTIPVVENSPSFMKLASKQDLVNIVYMHKFCDYNKLDRIFIPKTELYSRVNTATVNISFRIQKIPKLNQYKLRYSSDARLALQQILIFATLMGIKINHVNTPFFYTVRTLRFYIATAYSKYIGHILRLKRLANIFVSNVRAIFYLFHPEDYYKNSVALVKDILRAIKEIRRASFGNDKLGKAFAYNIAFKFGNICRATKHISKDDFGSFIADAKKRLQKMA